MKNKLPGYTAEVSCNYDSFFSLIFNELAQNKKNIVLQAQRQTGGLNTGELSTYPFCLYFWRCYYNYCIVYMCCYGFGGWNCISRTF
ncbi:MAG: hypothetical protein WAR79_16540 [Melioribacteraceae bacterium]